MEKSDNQPTGKHSIEGARLSKEEEALEVKSTVPSDSGDMVQPEELSVKEEAEEFIGKMLRLLVELKNQCGEDEVTKNIHDSIGFCVSHCYSRQEIEGYMLVTHGAAAELVGKLYDAIVLGTGDLSGGKAYEEHSIDCARLREEEAERRLSGNSASTSGREEAERRLSSYSASTPGREEAERRLSSNSASTSGREGAERAQSGSRASTSGREDP